MSYLNDKKAHGVDALPIVYLKRLGIQEAYRVFSLWTNKRLTKEENNYFSTARLVFLSKTKSETISSHKDYRCLEV